MAGDLSTNLFLMNWKVILPVRSVNVYFLSYQMKWKLIRKYTSSPLRFLSSLDTRSDSDVGDSGWNVVIALTAWSWPLRLSSFFFLAFWFPFGENFNNLLFSFLDTKHSLTHFYYNLSCIIATLGSIPLLFFHPAHQKKLIVQHLAFPRQMLPLLGIEFHQKNFHTFDRRFCPFCYVYHSLKAPAT